MSTYRFEELEIQLDGIFFGCFTGYAELEPDGYESFYVKAISLDGVKETDAPSPLRPWRKLRVPSHLELKRHSHNYHACTLNEFLFEALEKAVYADPKAKEFYQNELEAA